MTPIPTDRSSRWGEQALGRVLGPDGKPRDGGAVLDPAPFVSDIEEQVTPPSGPDELLPTGIKVIDLFAPVVRGGLMTMIGGSGVGKVVGTSELIHHLAEQQNGCGVFVALADQHYALSDLMADLRAGGINHTIALISVQQDDPPEHYQHAIQTGKALAKSLAEAGHEVLLCIDEPLVTGPIETLRTGKRAVTTMIWQFQQIEGDADLPDNKLLSTHDGQIIFNLTLAKNGVWPAIDPIRSDSRLLREGKIDAEHRRIAQAASDLLRQHEPLLGASSSDPVLIARARRVLLFQTQPFFVAEAFTARPGAWVPIDQTIAGYRALLDGRYDQRSEEELRFLGALPS